MTTRVELDLTKFEETLETYIDDNSRDIAIQIRKDARAGLYSSPHKKFKDKTGNLRKSIKIKKSSFDGGGYLVRAGGRGQMQAWLVAYGHGGPSPAAPHPYLRPALARNIKLAKETFEEGVRKACKKF